MSNIHRRAAVLFALIGVVWALAYGPARGDTITLTDGTKIEGKAIKQGEQYWVKPENGDSRMIPADKVQSIKRADEAGSAPAGSGAEYRATRRKTDVSIIAKDAAATWKAFIASHAGSADLPAARAEYDKWQALAAANSEKIRGKWVGGAELKALVDKSDELFKLSDEDFKANRALGAIQKLKQAAQIYPNNYVVNYRVGTLALLTRNHEEATPYFEQALRLRPDSAAAMNNLAVAIWDREKLDRTMFEQGTGLFLQAAKTEDSEVIAKNLMAVATFIPRDYMSEARWKEARSTAILLAAKYRLAVPKEYEFLLQSPDASRSVEEEGDAVSGSGFVINDGGLILTNRHVAAFGNKITVKLSDGTQKSAEVVVIDTEQDLALIKIKSDKAVPFLVFGKGDMPGEGAICFALGFPLIDRMGASLKITQGIVSGLRPTAAADIVIDAKVNPGNSGGPLVDKHGQVIGIVTQKSLSSESEDSYGIALSAGKIRKFLDKNHIKSVSETPDAGSLTAEEIVAKTKTATVCILVVRGPESTTKPAGAGKPK